MLVSRRVTLLLYLIPALTIVLVLLSPSWIFSQSRDEPTTIGEKAEEDYTQQYYDATRQPDAKQNSPRITHADPYPFIDSGDSHSLILGTRKIQNYNLHPYLLASDIEGNVMALDRKTGEVRWTILSERPSIETHSNTSNGPFSDSTWIVEPSIDGDLYVFNKKNGLTKLAISVASLVLGSPFSLAGEIVCTGVRKSSLCTIDMMTGVTVSRYGDESSDKIGTCNAEDDESRFISLGKTTYELKFHAKDNTSWNLTYSFWAPNNMDQDIALQHTAPIDDEIIQYGHDGSIWAMKQGEEDKTWINKLPYTIVSVIDVLENTEFSRGLTGAFHPVNYMPEKSELDKGVYLGITRDGSWYAMSGRRYPFAVQLAPQALYTAHDIYKSPYYVENPQHLNAMLTGVHYDTVYASIGSEKGLTAPGHLGNRYPTNTLISTIDLTNTYDPGAQQTGLRHDSSQDSLTAKDKGITFSNTIGRLFSNLLQKSIDVVIILAILWLALKARLFTPADILTENDLESSKLESEGAETSISGLMVANLIPNEKEKAVPEQYSEPYEVTIAAPKIPDLITTETQDEDTLVPEEITQVTKKEIKIVEPSVDDKMSADTNTGLKKRKRGSRGGKKSKKNNTSNNLNVNATEAREESDETVDVALAQSTPPTTALTPEAAPSSQLTPLALTLSNTILGYGASGTVVFKGTFQNRDVAVKRMLLEFCDLASREINLLTESDDHPNVIRYFYSEKTDKFLMIALELCSASLGDVIDNPGEYSDLLNMMDPVNVLEQIAKGVQHLHSLKIIHRDLKPQNILVAPPKKLRTRAGEFSPVRILISDFGLCKRLDADASSFRATTQNAGAGTQGWRAAELLDDESRSNDVSSTISTINSQHSTKSLADIDASSRKRLTRAVDIFPLGCVFYYILTNGEHPFGGRYDRESRILSGDYSLESLDYLPDNVVEAKDLISKMIAKDPSDRPDIDQVLKHPFFWNNAKKLEFLLKVSDRYEVEQRDPPSELLQSLEGVAEDVIGNDWCFKFERIFMDNLGKYRKYHGTRLMDLLRALRNKYHHFNDLPDELVVKMTPLPDGFYQYFNRKFPNLLMEIYKVVEVNLSDDHVLETFF